MELNSKTGIVIYKSKSNFDETPLEINPRISFIFTSNREDCSASN